MYTAQKIVKPAISKAKMKAKALPIADLRAMTVTELRNLTPVQISSLLFSKSLNFISADTKNVTIRSARSTWIRRNGFRQLIYCLKEDSDSVLRFLQIWEATNADMRFIANATRWERNALKKARIRNEQFIDGCIRYLKTQTKFSVSDADDIVKGLPEAAAACPLLLQSAEQGKIHYLSYVKKNKSRYAYEKAISEVGQSFSKIKKKTVLRQLFATHKLLFKHVTVDSIESSKLDAKEFTYVLVRCKPRDLSKDVIDYLESTTFLNTITGDITHTKILKKALTKLKDRYLEDEEKDTFGVVLQPIEEDNGHRTNTTANQI